MRFTNSCTEVVGKEPMLETQELWLMALDARAALDVLALRQTQIAPTTAISINNFYPIFILRRSIRVLMSLIFRQRAFNVLGGGFIGNSTTQCLSDHRTWDTENATQCTFTNLS